MRGMAHGDIEMMAVWGGELRVRGAQYGAKSTWSLGILGCPSNTWPCLKLIPIGGHPSRQHRRFEMTLALCGAWHRDVPAETS